MLLFFDTETTGLPLRRNASPDDISNWPRLVQLAWILQDEKCRVIQKYSAIIRPNGFKIPKETSDIHGITHEYALKEGIPPEDVLNEFCQAVRKSELLIAHNFKFDYPVIYAEFKRCGIPHDMADKKYVCTMMGTKNLLRIPHPKIRYDYKWPRLEELHRYLFHTDFKGAHNALTDVEITAKCFWELHRRNLIQVPHLKLIPDPSKYLKNDSTNPTNTTKGKSFYERIKELFGL